MLSIETLRQQALEKVRSEQFAEAVCLYDQALALASDEETVELLTINKADALIAMDQSGPAVQQLPAILLRRRNLHHVFLASYALMYKHRLKHEVKRAIFYGQSALSAAEEAGQELWQLAALNELGIIYEVDSQFQQAVSCFERSLALNLRIDDEATRKFSYAATVGNLGYNKIQIGQTKEGIALILSVIDQYAGTPNFAEGHIDLCYAFLELGQAEDAIHHGTVGLEHAVEARQMRNAHYLLGEAHLAAGDAAAADRQFEQLATYYPQFRNLKTLLYAVDLRSMMNLRL